MQRQNINNKIQRAFSQSAGQYDLHSSLHREIADKLFSQVIQESKPSALLDVGCGTGYLTGKLKDFFPQSLVIGLDFAQGMLEASRLKHENITWILADGNNLPFSKGRFDIVVSNLAYQWAEDLSHAFSEAKRVLASNGVFACTLFGYNTCHELFQSLDEASGGALQFLRLPDQGKVRKALADSGFKNPKVDCEHVKIEFKDMHELITWFKSIGAPHLPREGYLGAGAVSRAASIYREKFFYLQGVGATFEVIRVYAKE
ncbi:MAG: methyltransferase domain-containing protein [Candidatus Omnitrophica bacterium]|nr:methyltransferase domain-containing protein [Candidatus Omnitrophota bacterium]